MMSLQASMHKPQVMQASCWPLRMSMPIGQTFTQAMQSMQSPLPCATASAVLPPCLPRGSPRHSR
jgi:hypothetical protein